MLVILNLLQVSEKKNTIAEQNSGKFISCTITKDKIIRYLIFSDSKKDNLNLKLSIKNSIDGINKKNS